MLCETVQVPGESFCAIIHEVTIPLKITSHTLLIAQLVLLLIFQYMYKSSIWYTTLCAQSTVNDGNPLFPTGLLVSSTKLGSGRPHVLPFQCPGTYLPRTRYTASTCSHVNLLSYHSTGSYPVGDSIATDTILQSPVY